MKLSGAIKLAMVAVSAQMLVACSTRYQLR